MAKQPKPATVAELQKLLDRYRAYYNHERPHRAIGRRTPAEAYAARQKAAPKTPSLPAGPACARSLSPGHIVPALEQHLDRWVGSEPEAWLFGTSTGTALSPRNFQRMWTAARRASGRPDLHLHDLRHSGLTWSAATAATTAELMRRGGHANPRAALRYQHATQDRDQALADALARLATAKVVPLARRRSR